MSSDVPHRKMGKGWLRRMAERAKRVPARPMRRQRSEKTRMGQGIRVEEKAEKGFEGLTGLAE